MLAILLLAALVCLLVVAMTAARLTLIAGWRASHRLWSVRLAAFGSTLMGSLVAFPNLWTQAPPEVRAMLPAHAQALIPLLLFLATLAARFVKQRPAAPEPTS